MRQEKSPLREEPPCIWAQAGVLSYRPCDRQYDCDGCPLFHALRGGPGPIQGAELEAAERGSGVRALSPWQAELDAQVAAHLSRLVMGCTFHLDRAYSSGHWWVDAGNAPDLTLGIDGLVLRMLHPVDDIVAPPLGVWLRGSEPCGWIRRGHTSIPLHAPVAGEVVEVNDQYLTALKVWSAFGVGDEWLIRVKAHEDVATAPGLYRGDEALGRLLKDLQVLKGALREAVEREGKGDLGVTLADGGEPNLNLEAVLGRDRFDALVNAVFYTHP